MKVLKLISITFLLFLICIIEIYLNTFISLNFGIYIYFLTLLLISVDFYDQNLVLPIFLSGVLYDSFFSTYYMGLYSSIFILIVIIGNFLVSKYSKSNIIYFAILSICFLIYISPFIFVFDINYWLSRYLLSVIINFIAFMILKRIFSLNV